MKVKEAVAACRVPNQRCTYQDYLALPEDGNGNEIIEGELIMSPVPHTIHQKTSRKIVFEVMKFLDDAKCGELFYVPTDGVLSDSNIIQPDIPLITGKNSHIIREKCIHGVPDLIIEIRSPSTGDTDLIEKKELYEK